MRRVLRSVKIAHSSHFKFLHNSHQLNFILNYITQTTFFLKTFVWSFVPPVSEFQIMSNDPKL